MSEEISQNKRITLQQKEQIANFMQENHSFLMGKFGSVEGRMSKDRKWKEITDHLNKIGPQKDLNKWKKCWADMKSEVKKKLQLQRQNRNQTGAAPIHIFFSPLEERILSIVGEQLMDGDSDVIEIGFDSQKSDGKLKFD